MAERYYFWGKERPSSMDPSYEKTASRMYRQGQRIVVEGEMYDREDQRLYEQSGSVSVRSYKRALQTLRNKSEVVIVSRASHTRLVLKRQGDSVQIEMSASTYPSNTPGGASLSSSAVFHSTWEKLQLP